MSASPSFWSILPIFRATFLSRIPSGDHYPALRELRNYFAHFDFPLPCESDPLKKWFNFFYDLLWDKYRCEYVYKNVLATELYEKELHRIHDSLLINEFASGQSRADVVIMNGTSTAYEIKSNYDSLARLDQQIEDYRKIFDQIIVVTSPEKAKTVEKHTPPWVGVMKLTENKEVKFRRKPKSNKRNTDPAAIFDCMRKGEYCAILKEKFGYVPDVSNSRLYRESKKLFCQLDPAVAHDCMVGEFRKRSENRPFGDEMLEKIPTSLKHVCLSILASRSAANKIIEELYKPLKP